MAGPELNSVRFENTFQASARLEDLVYILLNVSLIRERRWKTGQRNRVHAVRRTYQANGAHLLRISDQHSSAQSGEAVCFRKGACHEQVGDVVQISQYCLSVKLEVGFVDQYGGVRRGTRGLEQLFVRSNCSSWIVRAGDSDQPRARRDVLA